MHQSSADGWVSFLLVCSVYPTTMYMKIFTYLDSMHCDSTRMTDLRQWSLRDIWATTGRQSRKEKNWHIQVFSFVPNCWPRETAEIKKTCFFCVSEGGVSVNEWRNESLGVWVMSTSLCVVSQIQSIRGYYECDVTMENSFSSLSLSPKNEGDLSWQERNTFSDIYIYLGHRRANRQP